MHLSKLPSGRWRVAVKHRGARRTGTADTKQQARELGADLVHEMGGTIGKRRVTVADILATYVTAGEARWSPTYLADVRATIDRIPETFLERPATTVTPSVVGHLYRGHWTPHRLRRLHEILAAAWERAVKAELVADNPFRRVDKPPKPRRRLTVPTHEQALQILSACGSDMQSGLALRLAATIGCRRGELVAIQWGDVDLERATVVIRRSLAYTPASGVVEGETKTGEAGHRVVALDLPTVAMLRRHKAHQSTLALAAGLTPRWVFSDDAGYRPWRPDRLTHLFADVRRAAGVTGVRFQDLRHYVATTMLEDGESPHDVANQLGHASTATTLAVYAHHLPGRGRESVTKRAARLDQKSS